jgi:hypothetical protein
MGLFQTYGLPHNYALVAAGGSLLLALSGGKSVSAGGGKSASDGA